MFKLFAIVDGVFVSRGEGAGGGRIGWWELPILGGVPEDQRARLEARDRSS